jgi:hypothetical protein
VTDQEPPPKAISFTKEDAIARLWVFATMTPEETKGSLKNQIDACRSLYEMFRYQPALQRLSEIATIDAARTKGSRWRQETAAKLLKRLVSSIKVDKNQGIQ